MPNFVQALINEIKNPKFRLWQNQVATDAKSSLQTSRTNKLNEVRTVTGLCNALNGKSFNGITLHSSKIHGPASTVSFLNESNKKDTREMSDMVVLSLITENGRVQYARMAFIQNKMEDKLNRWDIQQDQLYLLTNFPTFDGVSGIFKHMKNVALPDPFGRLGNYGLFRAPCEMVFASASVITALQSKTHVEFDDIKRLTAEKKYFLPNWGSTLHYLRKYCYLEHAMPIFGTCPIALNMHQFIRNWTQFNIGEEIVLDGVSQCYTLTDLARGYMQAAGMWELANLKFDYLNDDDHGVDVDLSDVDAAVMVVNLDVSNFSM